MRAWRRRVGYLGVVSSDERIGGRWPARNDGGRVFVGAREMA